MGGEGHKFSQRNIRFFIGSSNPLSDIRKYTLSFILVFVDMFVSSFMNFVVKFSVITFYWHLKSSVNKS